MVIDLRALAAPFAADEIEWRIGQAGKTGAGLVWAKVLAYVNNRAIMHRLDEVCRPENWKSEFTPVSLAGHVGFLCGLSVRVGADDWVTKWDGAGVSDVEPFKGGISDSMKRAGYQWGIGRYLYDLPEGWAITKGITRDTEGARYGKLKDGQDYYWLPPRLPDWALPKRASNGHLRVSEKEDDAPEKDINMTDKITQRRAVLANKFREGKFVPEVLAHFLSPTMTEDGLKVSIGKTFLDMDERTLDEIEEFCAHGTLPQRSK